MCGISGHLSLTPQPSRIRRIVEHMNGLIAHRGPDGQGVWVDSTNRVALGHRRLSILDIETGGQPMTAPSGATIVFNGEIYNYIELKLELGSYGFKTTSDTEVLLAAYEKWGTKVLEHIRGMFAFAIWDPKSQSLFCARDHFGIKPFYFTQTNWGFFFASEAKAVLPFLKSVEADPAALKEYFYFQMQLGARTLFKDVFRLQPGTYLIANEEGVKVEKFWTPKYAASSMSENEAAERLRDLLRESVKMHVRSDVPIGAYVSGGVDSSFVASMANKEKHGELVAFTGKFSGYEGKFDESSYARDVATKLDIPIYERDIKSSDFAESFQKIVYHMDYPEAGPGVFAQYCIAETASKHRKVVLGGQGGDEIFAGYARYLVGYMEQTLRESVEGVSNSRPGHMALGDLIEHMSVLKTYKPMIQGLFKDGLFGDLPQRYFSLVARAPDLNSVVNWSELGNENAFDRFVEVYEGSGAESDDVLHGMTGFDLRTLLPALLHVEDRVSMAWGLESRVPIVDIEVFKFASQLREDVKMRGGKLKGLLIKAVQDELPDSIRTRKDKMGFPVPLNQWLKSDLKPYVSDIFAQSSAKSRGFYDSSLALGGVGGEGDYTRNLWGLLSIESWHQVFIDNSAKLKFKE
jgi:asparagine synthase (glutamine-hydrolysing)